MKSKLTKLTNIVKEQKKEIDYLTEQMIKNKEIAKNKIKDLPQIFHKRILKASETYFGNEDYELFVLILMPLVIILFC